MADQPPQRQVPFMAPVIASMMAPIAETVRRGMTRTVIDVPCPDCGAVCALLDPGSRLLHKCAGDGGLGIALADDHRASVPVRCDRCGRRTSSVSGSAVYYRWRNDRPLLA